eukprot:6711792-Pyramimonas_sp.AAC.1
MTRRPVCGYISACPLCKSMSVVADGCTRSSPRRHCCFPTRKGPRRWSCPSLEDEPLLSSNLCYPADRPLLKHRTFRVLDVALLGICAHVLAYGCRVAMTAQGTVQLGKRVCAPAGSEYTTMVRPNAIAVVLRASHRKFHLLHALNRDSGAVTQLPAAMLGSHSTQQICTQTLCTQQMCTYGLYTSLSRYTQNIYSHFILSLFLVIVQDPCHNSTEILRHLGLP